MCTPKYSPCDSLFVRSSVFVAAFKVIILCNNYQLQQNADFKRFLTFWIPVIYTYGYDIVTFSGLYIKIKK